MTPMNKIISKSPGKEKEEQSLQFLLEWLKKHPPVASLAPGSAEELWSVPDFQVRRPGEGVGPDLCSFVQQDLALVQASGEQGQLQQHTAWSWQSSAGDYLQMPHECSLPVHLFLTSNWLLQNDCVGMP